MLHIDKTLAITGEVSGQTLIEPGLLIEDTGYMDRLSELLADEVELREVVRVMVAWANENF